MRCWVGRSNGNFAVPGAGILWNALAVVGTMDVHLAAAVGAVHQAGKGVRFAPAVRVAPDITPDALHVVKSFLVDDSFMGVFKNRPFAFIHIMAFLVLEVLTSLEVDRMAEIFPLFEDVDD